MQLNATEQKWFDQIQEARSSGLSDRAWCLQNNVPSSTFYYHVHKLRGKIADLPPSRSTLAPEIHEVVKVEILDEDDLPVSSYKKDPVIVQDDPIIGPDNNSTPKSSVFSARLQVENFTVDISNSASEQIILSVIKALRQSC